MSHDIYYFRGYYVRCKAISQVIATFIHGSTSDGQRQIISLGAGYDTTYFRLYAEGLIRNLKYFEVITVVYSLSCLLLSSFR